MKLGGPTTYTTALFGLALIPAVMIVGSTLSVWTGGADASHSHAIELGRFAQVWLCLMAAAFYFSQFEEVRRLMKGRIVPQ